MIASNERSELKKKNGLASHEPRRQNCRRAVRAFFLIVAFAGPFAHFLLLNPPNIMENPKSLRIWECATCTEESEELAPSLLPLDKLRHPSGIVPMPSGVYHLGGSSFGTIKEASFCALRVTRRPRFALVTLGTTFREEKAQSL